MILVRTSATRTRSIKEDVVKELLSEDTSPGLRSVIRIVRWNDGPPKLEKREQRRNPEGDWRNSKVVAFTTDDWLKEIRPNVGEITALLHPESSAPGVGA